MSRRIFLMVVFGLFSGVSTSYAQQKEYITFSDTKGKIIDCKGRAGFQGATLTIKFPTLAAYQKQYSIRHLVLDPDPPANLTLELGGYDGPCSLYEKKEMVLGGYPRLHGLPREFPEKMEIMYCKDGMYHFLSGVKNGKFSSVFFPKDKCSIDESKTQDLYGKIGGKPHPIAIDKFRKNWPDPTKVSVTTMYCGEDGKRYNLTLFKPYDGENYVPYDPEPLNFDNALLNRCKADPTINELAPERLRW